MSTLSSYKLSHAPRFFTFPPLPNQYFASMSPPSAHDTALHSPPSSLHSLTPPVFLSLPSTSSTTCISLLSVSLSICLWIPSPSSLSLSLPSTSLLYPSLSAYPYHHHISITKFLSPSSLTIFSIIVLLFYPHHHHHHHIITSITTITSITWHYFILLFPFPHQHHISTSLHPYHRKARAGNGDKLHFPDRKQQQERVGKVGLGWVG